MFSKSSIEKYIKMEFIPNPVKYTGIDVMKKWYLFTKFRSFVPVEYKDIICPHLCDNDIISLSKKNKITHREQLCDEILKRSLDCFMVK